MTEEIFDIVNERDEVVGQAPRSEVHRTGLRHRAVHVLVFNARGEVFLQKRSMLKDTAKGKWDSSASGHVDSGEDYDPCAVRELREEIGLHLSAAARADFAGGSLPGNGERICLGISVCERGAVHLASGGNRARRVVCAGGGNAPGAGATGRVCAGLHLDLEFGCQRKEQNPVEKILIRGLTVFTVPHKQTAQFNRKQPCLKNQSNNASRTSSSNSSA
jgi:ADP-ribose pyrophosphatase YjhB (NUDIX family)